MLGQEGLLSDDTRPKVKFAERGREYEAENRQRKRVLRYRVDGGVIQAGRKSCDFALGVPQDETVYFVELKGMNLREAAVQIFETVRYLDARLSGFTVEGRIVLSRVPRPDLRSTPVVRLERELARRRGSLKYAGRKLIESI